MSDQLHIGVTGSVVLESDEDPPAGHYFRRELFYGRHGERFRIYVRHFMEFEGSVETDEETLWANCPRDVKLMSFNRLPDLLDQLVNCLEATLEQVRLNSETIQALLPQPKAKGAKS